MADASAEMGVACTRPGERVLAALGVLQGAPTQFEAGRDVSFGGVLCGLPALAQNGLFEHLHTSFPSLAGYYTTLQVVTLLAHMALCRIKTANGCACAGPPTIGSMTRSASRFSSWNGRSTKVCWRLSRATSCHAYCGRFHTNRPSRSSSTIPTVTAL